MSKKYRALDRRQIKTAHHISVMWCGDPNCGPHIVLFDEHDVPFAEAVISDRQAPAICDIMLNGGPE